MARYSPELLAALRYRYEQTGQPMNALAAEFEIGVTTLQTLARKNGWMPRSQRLRQCPPAMRLLDEAEALTASLPLPEMARVGVNAAVALETTHVQDATASPILPLAGGESNAMPAAAPTTATLSPLERIEALIVKELAAEEALRAALGTKPRARYDLERCARTLAVMTQTLERLQRLHPKSSGGKDVDHDPVPENIDEFREELAKRINAFVESRVGKERMALNRRFAKLTDAEMEELAAVGHERGMRALLEPPEPADDADIR
jgi:hypothetical protein